MDYTFKVLANSHLSQPLQDSLFSYTNSYNHPNQKDIDSSILINGSHTVSVQIPQTHGFTDFENILNN
jgi:hypothetical protein